MYNLLLDSDSLIKLAHAGVIQILCREFNCLITKEVEEETVTEGKRGLYQDALLIEKLIKGNFIKIKESKKGIKIEENFGEGEKSILELYHGAKSSMIVSDDSKFIKYLEKEGITFFIPSDTIILLKQLGKISAQEALHFLDGLKAFIRDEVYKETKKELRGD